MRNAQSAKRTTFGRSQEKVNGILNFLDKHRMEQKARLKNLSETNTLVEAILVLDIPKNPLIGDISAIAIQSNRVLKSHQNSKVSGFCRKPAKKSSTTAVFVDPRVHCAVAHL